ncbi:MAG TPA: hypothetical protein VKB16_13960 [Beijerinckiaceae bacterium]|nr:hypothetical protein [Beijerinckiaceae bacterium]
MTLYTNLLNASASHRLEAFFGIGPGLQQRVAAIAILSAMIERQVELALWTLESERFRPGLNDRRDAADRSNCYGRILGRP